MEKRVVCPELVDLVTEGGGTVLESAKERAEGVILFGECLGDVETDEGERAAVLGGGTGAKLAHDEGDHGIGAVAHFFGEGLDSASGGFADTGIVTKGEGYSGFADAGGLSKVCHTEGLHREEGKLNCSAKAYQAESGYLNSSIKQALEIDIVKLYFPYVSK